MSQQKIDRPTIYTVGDSHGWHAWLHIHNVKTNYVASPMTMYNFAHCIDAPSPIMLQSVPREAIVCFCHGEIDCRCYVHDYQPWQATVDKLVANYIRAIDYATVGRNPKLIWIFTIVPPVREPVSDNAGFPFRGTVEERVMYSRYMNKKLKESKYTFIDLYAQLSDEDGCMKTSIGDGHVHVSDPTIIIDWLNNESLYTELK